MAVENDYFTSELASNVFLVELGVSGVLLLAVLVTILFSPTIHRSAVSINVYLSFLVYSLSYLLLPITGQWNTAEPPLGLCLLSGVLDYASFPFCAAAVLALSISVWLNVCHHGIDRPRLNLFLIFAPYVVWIFVLLEEFMVITTHRSDVFRNGYPYCLIADPIPGIVSRAILAICLLPSMVFQGLTLLRLFSVASPFHKNPVLRKEMRQRVIRMSVFSLGSIAAVILAFSFSMSLHGGNTVQVVVQGSFPLWTVLVLGTQNEIFQSWKRLFTRSRPQTQADDKGSIVSTQSSEEV